MALENPDLATQFKDKECLLSVIMVTYNQKNYIEQAVKSVLDQKTNFRFQILIGDDASTDGTSEIVLNYSKKYPGIVIPFLHENNLGKLGKNNFIHVFSKCKTKYATILEGDDYWTDPFKLQKQVDFLEKNNNYSMCFHAVQLLKNDALKKDYLNYSTKPNTDIYDLAAGNYIRTLSCVFVNRLNGVLPDICLKQWGFIEFTNKEFGAEILNLKKTRIG
jgi:glycosyltransferase involved in cell wall biosynthesis